MDQDITQDNNNQPMPKQSNQIPSWIGFIIIIVIAAIIFGGVFAYQYFSTKTQPVVQPQNTQNQNVKTAGWKTYTNNNYGIEFKYPSDSAINDVDTTGGRTLSLNIEGVFLEINIQNQMYGSGGTLVPAICNDDGGFNGPSVETRINGINFIKTDVSGDYGGMVSAAVAESFCIVHNNVRYRIVPRIGYSRYTGGGTQKGDTGTVPNPGPDKDTSFEKFEQIVTDINFKFTK